MARLGRYFLPDQPLHVIRRGNNREAIFFDPGDYARYRDWLTEAAGSYGCAIHAYVLMTNHVHLLVTPLATDSLPRTMQSLGRGSCALRQRDLSKNRDPLGGTLPCRTDRRGGLFPFLLPLYRTQSSASANR